MGAGASAQNSNVAFSSAVVEEELKKPEDGSDLQLENAKEEVVRLRKLLQQQLIKERLGNAAMGSLVGNASAMPVEWFYNRDHLKKLLGDSDAISTQNRPAYFFTVTLRRQRQTGPGFTPL